MTVKREKVRLEKVLDELIDYRGKTPPKSAYGIPLVTAKIIKKGFIQSPNEFVSEDVYKKWMVRGFPKVGDVVLTSEAPLGEVAFIKNSNIALAQRVFTLRGDGEKLDTTYLKYFLQSSIGQDRLNKRSSGTTVKGIKQSELRKIEIDLPDIHLQKSISSIIYAYDDLIENNEKRIKLLEAMTQRLYTEWFVSFKFPDHEKVKMVDSGTEHGMIPEGWEVMPIEQAIKISPITKYEKGKPIRHVGMGCISETASVIDISGIEQKDKPVGVKFQNKDTLFSRITPCLQNGKTAYVNFLDEGEVASGSTEFLVMREDKLTPTYIYLLARNNDFRESAKLAMVGASGRQRVHAGFYKKYQVVVPPKEILYEFEEIVDQYFILSNSLNNRNHHLSKTRDLLIENLVTGKRLLK